MTTSNATPLPAIFVSHGSPMIALLDTPARRFLAGLGAALPRPRAILVASAHWETEDAPALSLAGRPETIHDFRGFPPDLYALRYPAPGAPEVARRAADLLEGAGFAPRLDPARGLDHGVWVPLLLGWPAADVPVVSLSVQPRRDAAHHLALGRALAPLRAEGVLVIGSGSFTHNLYEMDRRPDAPAAPWALAFADAAAAALERGDTAALLDWRSLPEGPRNHPTPEHLLPLFVAMGAGGGGDGGRATALHRSTELGALAMDAWRFG